MLKRNNLNNLPAEMLEKKSKKPFKEYDVGFVHIDIATVHTNEGKAYLFVAIERQSRYAYAELYSKMTAENTCLFLQSLIVSSVFKITNILTDNGTQFTYRLLAKHLQPTIKKHPFDVICDDHKIEDKLTQFMQPWTNELVERMNRTIKEATVKIYFYESLEELKKHLML